MKQKSIKLKKVYKEKIQDEICNFNPNSINISDTPDTRTRENTIENTNNNINFTNNHNSFFQAKTKNRLSNKSSSSREREICKKTSRKSSKNSKNSFSNLDPPGNSPLMLLVDSFKEKINFYENEMRNLIDEKIQMQMTINNLQIKQMKKCTNNSQIMKSGDNTISNINKSSLISDNNKALKISHESVFELQNQSRVSEKISNNNNNIVSDKNKYFNDNPRARNNSYVFSKNQINSNVLNNNKDSFINSHQDNLDRQKKILENNKFILDDTLNNQNITDFGNLF